jgi:hypothetical protein
VALLMLGMRMVRVPSPATAARLPQSA